MLPIACPGWSESSLGAHSFCWFCHVAAHLLNSLIIVFSHWRLYRMGQHFSRNMTKPTKWVCAQRRLRSAWASAQSDQSLRCPHEESLGSYLPIERKAETLIRLGGCPGWPESSLDAHSFCCFCHVVAHFNRLHKRAGIITTLTTGSDSPEQTD